MDENLISIVVPVYNIEKYLRACVDSLIMQTYSNLQILLIDDGSTDTSGTICDEYVEKDSRIIVIHKENGGLSDARNTGIEHCRGKYISFVDGDDIVSKHFIEYFWLALEKEASDIVSLRVTARFWDGIDEKPNFKEARDYSIETYNTKEALELLLYQQVPTGMPHRIYRATLFDNIRFPKGLVYEDLATAYKLFMSAKKISFIDPELYGYRLRKDSTIRRKFNIEKLSCISISKDLFDKINETYPGLINAAASRAFAANTSVFLQAPYRDKTTINKLWNEMRYYRSYLLHDKSKLLRTKNKMCAWLMFLGKGATYVIGKKFGQKGSMYP